MDELKARLSGKEELCRKLEQQLSEQKQGLVKCEGEISQLRRSLEGKEEGMSRLVCLEVERICVSLFVIDLSGKLTAHSVLVSVGLELVVNVNQLCSCLPLGFYLNDDGDMVRYLASIYVL